MIFLMRWWKVNSLGDKIMCIFVSLSVGVVIWLVAYEIPKSIKKGDEAHKKWEEYWNSPRVNEAEAYLKEFCDETTYKNLTIFNSDIEMLLKIKELEERLKRR